LKSETAGRPAEKLFGNYSHATPEAQGPIKTKKQPMTRAFVPMVLPRSLLAVHVVERGVWGAPPPMSHQAPRAPRDFILGGTPRQGRHQVLAALFRRNVRVSCAKSGVHRPFQLAPSESQLGDLELTT
jgi:hypothetical protein